MASRKRRAPGASPSIPQQADIQSNPYSPAANTLSADQFTHNWSGPGMEGDMSALFTDPALYDYAGGLAATGGQPSHSRVISLDGLEEAPAVDADIVSGQLVRRNPNHQLAPRGRNAWDGFNNEKQGEWPSVGREDEELEQKALMARRDAQSKRKQIPPFVQKLSSFLDDNKNTNLIRWSDDGNSFIVLDEDEFARTLIPELFKHNNYASFVRQLNMYGFHKKVGLSDNSMKASELKSKAPSEYYNKYFKRGRPELLWLIQKPKNASHPKRKRDEDGKHGDSEDERKYAQEAGGTGAYGEDLAVRGNQEMAMIPRTEYNSLRNEVRALQQQQKAISNVLTSIRRQNDQLYQQATAFQTLHERHENSINAILTFLATFYNRSLEGGSGTNLADLFHPNMTQQQPRGNVVDVDDFPDKDFGNKSSQMQIQRPGRRSLALLPAPLAKDSATKGDRAATLSPPILPAGASSKPKAANRPPVFRSPTMSRSTSASVGLGTLPGTSSRSSTLANVETPPTPTPQAPQPLPENEEIMSHIQNVNANTSQAATQIPYLDNLSAALANYQTQGGNMPLTPQQRNDMLSLMANNVSAASPNSQLAQNSNNAMVNPQPPAIPDLPEIHETQNQLELLRRLSDGTSNRIQHLQERLQPLSPSGHIPGIGEENSYFDNVPLGEPAHYDLDMESFVNDDFFPSANPTVSGAAATDGQNGAVPATAGPADTNLSRLNLDDLNDTGHTDAAIDSTNLNDDDDDLFGENSANDDGGQIESLSSSTTSPAVAAGVGDNVEEQNTRSPKRMRK